MKILITGGCGFLGSNLALYGIENGCKITIFDNLSRVGSKINLAWLQSYGEANFTFGDIQDKKSIQKVIQNEKFDAIFHLAGKLL